MNSRKPAAFLSGISILLVFAGALFPLSLWGAGESRIGVVDLVAALSLHPRMALFDFQRKGFFRLPLGLSPGGWANELAKLGEESKKRIPALEKELEKLDSEFQAVDARRAALLNGFSPKAGNETASDLEALGNLADEIRRIEAARNEIRFEMERPELTPPGETVRILDEIEREVLDTVGSVAERLGCDVVLNQSVPSGVPWKPRSEIEIIEGRGFSFLANTLFYGFLANKGDDPASHPEQLGVPTSLGIMKWMDLTRNPAVMPLLPLQPHPLVLKGGRDLTPEVVRTILENYRCDPASIFILDNLLKSRVGH